MVRTPEELPRVIQGGMGVGVSSWQLAREVARAGQLGVVSGTALDTVLARRLQDGDPEGTAREALAHCPLPELGARVERQWFQAGGRQGRPYRPAARLGLRGSQQGTDLAVAGAFVEVWLARQGHDGPIGINLLEKIQMATPAAAYGAILAGASHVLMGAGIPRELPTLLTRLSRGEPGGVHVDVAGGDPHWLEVDPAAVAGGVPLELERPRFLAIVSGHTLAGYLCRDDATRPDGFVVEGPEAGGHNAPPRGRLQLDDTGQPVYGPKDAVEPAKMVAVGLPFWLAGGYGEPERVAEALAAGAAGVQVGTLFALARESGLLPGLRAELLERLRDGSLDVRTDAAASPTGFPFKVARIAGTLADPEVYAARPRLCDLGYLRTPYARDGGAVGYRCAAEPVDVYVRKGGSAERAAGAVCLCNALTADIGLGQERKDGYVEAALLTLGADLKGASRLAEHTGPGDVEWTARQAVDWLLGTT